MVQRLIGPLDNRRGFLCAAFQPADANADGDGAMLPFCIMNDLANALGKLERALHRRLHQEDGEFFAAVARHAIRRARSNSCDRQSWK